MLLRQLMWKARAQLLAMPQFEVDSADAAPCHPLTAWQLSWQRTLTAGMRYMRAALNTE